ncbi:hypothetical protein Agub_g4963, partial [Astrephomene gubernaculifera]
MGKLRDLAACFLPSTVARPRGSAVQRLPNPASAVGESTLSVDAGADTELRLQPCASISGHPELLSPLGNTNSKEASAREGVSKLDAALRTMPNGSFGWNIPERAASGLPPASTSRLVGSASVRFADSPTASLPSTPRRGNSRGERECRPSRLQQQGAAAVQSGADEGSAGDSSNLRSLRSGGSLGEQPGSRAGSKSRGVSYLAAQLAARGVHYRAELERLMAAAAAGGGADRAAAAAVAVAAESAGAAAGSGGPTGARSGVAAEVSGGCRGGCVLLPLSGLQE